MECWLKMIAGKNTYTLLGSDQTQTLELVIKVVAQRPKKLA